MLHVVAKVDLTLLYANFAKKTYMLQVQIQFNQIYCIMHSSIDSQ